MTPELHQRASELFLKICDLSPGVRGLVLDRECGADAELRRVVEALLAADPGEAARLAVGVPVETGGTGRNGTAGVREEHDALINTDLGPYSIVRRLGEGGMGSVYLAEQTQPIRRQVAIKVIKLGMDTRSVIARFEAEREALSLMNHPSVARVLDAGATETGRPYFVMEFVEGVPITAYADEHRLSTSERLMLFMDVCAAVQHAHQKGIIHRDIKPSNVLITEVDGKPIPKVIDFGIAKATQQPQAEQTSFTEVGQLIGTPGYMSPEQAGGKPGDVDTRTDIYSLGVLLYELVVGKKPFDDATLRKAGYAEIQRIIREVEPPRPSTRLSSLEGEGTTVAALRRTSLAALTRHLRADLDWVVMNCLEKDRARRYDTANALAMDIQRFLKSEPVAAGPPSAVYRFRRFARRNRVALASAATVVAALCLGLALAVTMYLRAEESRVKAANAELQARSEAARAEQILTFVHDFLGAADPHESGRADTQVAEILDRAAENLSTASELDTESVARVSYIIGRAYRGIGNYTMSAKFLQGAISRYSGGIDSQQRRLATALHDFGWVLHDQGDYAAAKDTWERALEIRMKALGDTDGDTAQSLAAVADAKKHLGDREGAALDFDRALAHARKSVGPEHDTTLEIMNDLAVFLLSLGQQRDAESLLREVVLATERKFGSNHPRVLQSKANLADALRNESKFVEAEKLLLEVIQEAESRLGSSHPRVFEWKWALSRVLTAVGRLQESTQLLEDAVVIARSTHGNRHPAVLSIRMDLARNYMAMGRSADAVELMEEALVQTRSLVGEQHQDYAWRLADLGRLLAEAGQDQRALDLLLASKQLFAQLRDPGDIEVCWRLVDIARVRSRLGDRDAAIGSVREALRLARERYGNESVEIFRLGLEASHLLGSLGEMESATVLRDEAFRLCQTLHADNEQLLWGDLQAVVFDLVNAKDYAKALHLMWKDIEIRRRLFGEEELVGDKYWIAWTLFASGGSAEEEEELLLSALETCNRKWGPCYGETIRTKQQLAAVYRREQRFRDAEEVLCGILDSLFSADSTDRVSEEDTIGRMIRLYETWAEVEPDGGHSEQAAEWRSRLKETERSSTAASPKSNGS